MKRLTQAGKNIVSLAKIFNEFPSSIALKLGFNPRLISVIKYGYTDKVRGMDAVEKLSVYFGVSTEAFLKDDLTLGSNLSDPLWFTKNIYSTLPLLVSDEALENHIFAKAYSAQTRLYDADRNFKPLKNPAEIRMLFTDARLYYDLWEAGEGPEETIVNLVSLFFYEMLCRKSEEIVSRYTFHEEPYPAVIDYIRKIDHEFDRAIEYVENSKEIKDGTPFQDLVCDDEFDLNVDEMLFALRKKDRDLADYYMCLLYIFGARNNNFTVEQNNEFGIDLMIKLADLENHYAEYFMSMLENSIC